MERIIRGIEYALSPTPFSISDTSYAELAQLFSMILRRIDKQETNEPKTVLQNLSCAVVGIISDSMQEIIGQKSQIKRHLEITLAFKELFSEEKQINRNISYYAEALHISPVYLNEVIKDITGTSVSKYVQNELMLRAKRMLAHTTLRISEISALLGIDDCAYFTRLFTKTVGINPTCFRKKYLE